MSAHLISWNLSFSRINHLHWAQAQAFRALSLYAAQTPNVSDKRNETH